MKKRILLSILLNFFFAIQAFPQATGIIIANLPSGGSIGSASTTVDVGSYFNINQTTSGQTITIPNPSLTTATKNLRIRNIGTTAFTLSPGGVCNPSTYGIELDWTGSTWAIMANASASGGSPGNLTGAVTSVGLATSLGSFSSSNLSTALTDETGSGQAVFGTAPTVTGGNITALSNLSIQSSGSSNTLSLATNEATTANRTLNFVVGDANRNITFGQDFQTNGSHAITLINTNSSAATCSLPLSGSLYSTRNASMNSSQLYSSLSDPTGTGGSAVFNLSPTLSTPVINIGSDATGDIYYRNSGGLFTRLPIGSTNNILTVSGGLPSWAAPSGATGTVTSVSVTTANGVSGTVATATTTPAISLTLGAITPTSVNGVTLSGSSTPTLAVTGTTSVSGTNTGDQTASNGLTNTSGNITLGGTLTGTTNIVTSGNTFSVNNSSSNGSYLNLISNQYQLGYNQGLIENSIGTNANNLYLAYNSNFILSEMVLDSFGVGITTTGNSGDRTYFKNSNSGNKTTVTIPNITGNMVIDNATQTLTNKTLTSPKINVTSDATGDIYYRNSGGLFTRLAIGSTNNVLSVSGGIPSWSAPSTGTVTSVSVTTANGVSGTVATATTTPAISLTLGAITPTSVNGVTLSGSSTPTLAVTGTTSVSGTNTGDQTNITGNAATVTTNANLTGPITSSGNATSIASQTGTGTTFAMQTSPNFSTSIGLGTSPAAVVDINQGATASAWTTNGIGLRIRPTSFTDNSSSGTVASVYMNTVGAPTLLASSATTYTNPVGTYFDAPIASTNVTFTNPAYAIGLNGNLLFTGASRTVTSASGLTVGVGASVPLTFQQNGSNRYMIAATTGNHTFTAAASSSGTNTFMTFTQPTNTGGVSNAYVLTAAPHTGQTASTEINDVNYNLARTVTWATGTLATQRFALFQAPTIAFAGASTVTQCATVAINNAPQAGTNATLSEPLAFWCQGGNVRFDGTRVRMKHLSAIGVSPTIAAGAGAGGSPTVSITGMDMGGNITITTGTLPTLSATVATITFNTAYSNAPRAITLTPANSNAALLSGVNEVFIDNATGILTGSFNITSGTTALTAATTYMFYYTVIE